MLLTCLALRVVKYSDSRSILTAYSRERGRVSLQVSAARGAGASRLRALVQPLGRVCCEAELRPGREIAPMREVVSRGAPSALAAANPLRASIAIFISDLLTRLLREPQADEALFEYLDFTAEQLYQVPAEALPNFPLAFLMQLLRYAGIEPDWHTFRPGYSLDMLGGIFCSGIAGLHQQSLLSVEAAAAHAMRRLNFRTAPLFRFTPQERTQALDTLLGYYRLHLPWFTIPTSLEILRQL